MREPAQSTTAVVAVVGLAMLAGGCRAQRSARPPPLDARAAGGAADARAATPAFALPVAFDRRRIDTERDENKVNVWADLLDADRDGLRDDEEAALGTNPRSPDTDGDGLLDGWEVHKLPGLDLHAQGASPLHRDIFIEMDWMEPPAAPGSLKPSAQVLRRIEAAFASAPARRAGENPGIALHLEWGSAVAYDPDLEITEDNNEFYVLKSLNFSPLRAPVYHYMIWADSYNGGASSGLSMSTPGVDFIVTLGGVNVNGGTDDEKVGTFVHELGHNLGLLHGGVDGVSYKPNHLSVMNYSFQTRGVRVGDLRLFTYQPVALGPLDENSLSETAGLSGGPALRGYHTRWYLRGRVREAPADGPIDWDGKEPTGSIGVELSINMDKETDVLQGGPNEWGKLQFRSVAIGSQKSRTRLLDLAKKAFVEQAEPELSIEDARALERTLAVP